MSSNAEGVKMVRLTAAELESLCPQVSSYFVQAELESLCPQVSSYFVQSVQVRGGLYLHSLMSLPQVKVVLMSLH